MDSKGANVLRSSSNLEFKQDRSGIEQLFAGGGELGSLMQSIDWSKTALGPVENWPQNLKTCVRIVLTSRQPMFVWWGDDLINIYNDAYKSIVGGKHPAALGQPASVVWHEIWDQVGPRAASAMQSNEGTYDESLLLIMERYGYREETYYTFSYSPVPNDHGGNGGIICANTDDTRRILTERQLGLMRELAARTADARSWREACDLSAKSLASDPKDVCFALIYMLDRSKKSVVLAGSTGIGIGHPAAPPTIALEGAQVWPINRVLDSHEIQLVTDLGERFQHLPADAWDEPSHTAAVVPVLASGPTGRAGVIVVGLNPYRLPDDSYSGFLKLLAGQISASVGNAEAYEQERSRAEALAELDRAKTTFFSNVSHEFRTPLTLMLGPLEDLLLKLDGQVSPEYLSQLEIVHRNGLRLLKLVNTLLDFSRIEAGRIRAAYRPLDLASVTTDLASVFRSTMERAGLRFEVHCEPLPEPVYIDAEMWEKIVLNLLSNAFKFTLDGGIEVAVRADGANAVLTVRDTGTGIPEQELPRIFERFHRVDGARGRTHEGTGIGLALVDELVRLHGGTVSVESHLGKGTQFTVRIPFGIAHLPSEKIAAEQFATQSAVGAAPYIQEAMRWLPTPIPTNDVFVDGSANDDLTGLFDEQGESAGRGLGRILLADDNRDMREYVRRLLARKYDLVAVEDGEQALMEALHRTPDLVVTDVMMPKLDGFGLLKALRENPSTAAVPVIMLSARAGEEARVEGMEAGADDYLVKPFTTRELLARVNAHITMHKLRSELTAREHIQRLKAESAEQQFRMMLESISEGFIFLDREWNFQYVNTQAAMLVDRPSTDLVGKNIWEVFPYLAGSRFGNAYRDAMQTGSPIRFEDHYEPLNLWIHANVYPSVEGLSIFLQDVTERREQEKRLLVTEKLAATGRLAATIAHEINNPLESVLNLLYLARISRTASEDEIRDYLVTAEKELARVAQIARHTLGFYRETSIATDLDLTSLLDDVAAVYSTRLQSRGIRLRRDYRTIAPIHALRGELQQVFSNLVSNAIDAMQGTGELLLAVEESVREAKSGVQITVGDTGCGILPEHRKRLFEPFFTTKVSVGTGLGLWVVKQFVQGHGGAVTVDSSTDGSNRGTKFIVFLPYSAEGKAQNDPSVARKQKVM